MINIVFKKKDNLFISFEINGHAGYSKSGTDIVCSAVSALAYTFANGITDVVKVNACIDVFEDGFLNLDISHLDKENIEKCQVLLETMFIGLKSMNVMYGKYISIKLEEV
jgi:uncharacterized protein YsxB (DUF464 family)